MRPYILLFLIFFGIKFSKSQDKYALIVGVGEYPVESGWDKLNSANDVILVKNSLIRQDFPVSNITVLQDEHAQKLDIVRELKELSKVEEGSIVFIHFSAHGQLIFDGADKDELIDGYDEAIVPYGAYRKYGAKKLDGSEYIGADHLRDDELGQYLNQIRKAIGKDGQLVVLLDTCHSGTASRGVDESVFRGSSDRFEPPDYNPTISKTSTLNEGAKISIIDGERINLKNASPYVVISASRDNELNKEKYVSSENKMYGPLSLAFTKALESLQPKDENIDGFSYRQLFSEIKSIIKSWRYTQNPTIEGDSDLMLFNNSYVSQKSYYEILEGSINARKEFEIDAGKLSYLTEGSTVVVCKNATKEPKTENIIARGKIVKVKLTTSLVSLDGKLPDINEESYWVFIDRRKFTPMNISVFINENIKDRDLRTSLASFLEETKVGTIVNSPVKAELAIRKDDSKGTPSFTFYNPGYVKGIFKVSNVKMRGPEAYAPLKSRIIEYARAKYMADFRLRDNRYELEAKWLPVSVSFSNNSIKEVSIRDEEAILNSMGDIVMRHSDKSLKGDAAILSIRNKGTQPTYFTIVEINERGQIIPVLPNCCNEIYQLDKLSRVIQPGETVEFIRAPFWFSISECENRDEETLMLKIIATSEPLEVRHILKFQGCSADDNCMCDYTHEDTSEVEATFRGGMKLENDPVESKNQNSDLKGWTQELVYHIIK